PVESVEWSGAEPKRYVSSPGIKRAFCGDCGSTLTFEVHDEAEQFLFMALGSLDHPEAVDIDDHVFTDFRLPCVHTNDGLPEFPGMRGGKGGREL
ncbi:MAG: GFA family protein, partial [Pseudomonadota bacterium]